MADNFYGITDTGRQRTNNEDAFIAQKVMGDGFVMACVIDGVGGYEGGEVAARLARETILHYFSIPSGDIPTMMLEALAAANEKIKLEKRGNDELASMACVVTLALVDVANHLFYYTHVGDTRLYLYRDASLVKITKDHSFVGFLEDNGRLSEEAAMNHPKRNEIDKALGFENSATINGNYIEAGQSPFLPGDILLLCSDGLSDLVSNSEMTAILQNNKTLEGKAKALVNAANIKGGKDNITVVLVQNNNKGVKQRATKPVLVKKKDQPKQNLQPIQKSAPQIATPAPAKKRSYKNALILVSILCGLLIMGLAYVLWTNASIYRKNIAANPTNLNESEVALQASLLQLQGNRFSFTSALNDSITISDTLQIDKDTLYINGGNKTVLIADSNYRGPAFSFLKESQNIYIDSITLQNFDVGLLALNTVLHLKEVSFINCRVPVQYLYNIKDDGAVNGVIKNQLFSSVDTLIKTSKQ